MMNFELVNEAISKVLAQYSNGRFQVVGFQRQVKSAQEVEGNNRMVQSFYSSGNFPKSSGRQTGSTQHDMTFNIGLTVSAAAEADLNYINNPNATTAQIANGLAAFQEAASKADKSIDELARHVYQILMDALNSDLCFEVGVMSSRWISAIRKDAPTFQGSLVILTGSIEYTCNTVEEITGDTPLEGGTISTIIDIEGDDVEKTGVETQT